MGNLNAGQVVEREVEITEKVYFNWGALALWIGSLLLSLMPMFVSMLGNLAEQGDFNIEFWVKCIVAEDVLWVFGTLLLFALVNRVICGMTRQKKTGKCVWALYFAAIVIFVFSEATWLVLRLQDPEPAVGLFLVCVLFIIISLVISTPLEISFIKNGG